MDSVFIERDGEVGPLQANGRRRIKWRYRVWVNPNNYFDWVSDLNTARIKAREVAAPGQRIELAWRKT